ncbi:MAG: hypothetical protein Q7U28_04355 [Aquabacterium sp.]|nr:hypothetical protein [Aquabacterium sp.]
MSINNHPFKRWLPHAAACLLAAAMAACGSGSSSDASATPAEILPLIRQTMGLANPVSVSIDLQATGRPVNRRVLGQNMQWVDRGDGMFDTQGQIRPAMLALVQQMAPTMLRYPGGLQSDTYHWERGMGPIATRGSNQHANAVVDQPTIVGTQEFLELCEATGAQPLITVNMITGTAQEAAAWVKRINVDGLTSSRTGKPLPKVTQWELGNEPYLKPNEQPSLWVSPTEFGKRAAAFTSAMRAVDPSIEVSLPLANDLRNGITANAFPGFTREVLKTPMPGLNHVSLHNSYVPLAFDPSDLSRGFSNDQLYWAAMAGTRTIEADFQTMRTQLATLLPGQKVDFAVTEYNSLFTLGKGASDQLPQSPAGALVMADILRLLASTPDVAMANYWSLSGNGFFGAIQSQPRARPVFEVFKLYKEALQGQWLPVTVTAPSVDTPSIGLTAAVKGLPVAEALVTRSGNTLRVLIIHKDPSNPARVALRLGQTFASAVTAQSLVVLTSSDVFDTSDRAGLMQREESTLAISDTVELPPHSLALVTLTLK